MTCGRVGLVSGKIGCTPGRRPAGCGGQSGSKFRPPAASARSPYAAQCNKYYQHVYTSRWRLRSPVAGGCDDRLVMHHSDMPQDRKM
eukprot:2633292-Pyramimonas_sp.AAC.2